MSTDAGSAAAPEDAATRAVASERPGLESADPESADSATSTEQTADRGVEGSARPEPGPDSDRPASSDTASAGTEASDSAGDADGPPAEGFVASLIRDSTVTGLPGDTGAPPAEPHAPQAQQQGDEPVGSEPGVDEENPRGVE
jgi:hypothetical protein